MALPDEETLSSLLAASPEVRPLVFGAPAAASGSDASEHRLPLDPRSSVPLDATSLLRALRGPPPDLVLSLARPLDYESHLVAAFGSRDRPMGDLPDSRRLVRWAFFDLSTSLRLQRPRSGLRHAATVFAAVARTAPAPLEPLAHTPAQQVEGATPDTPDAAAVVAVAAAPPVAGAAAGAAAAAAGGAGAAADVPPAADAGPPQRFVARYRHATAPPPLAASADGWLEWASAVAHLAPLPLPRMAAYSGPQVKAALAAWWSACEKVAREWIPAAAHRPVATEATLAADALFEDIVVPVAVANAHAIMSMVARSAHVLRPGLLLARMPSGVVGTHDATAPVDVRVELPFWSFMHGWLRVRETAVAARYAATGPAATRTRDRYLARVWTCPASCEAEGMDEDVLLIQSAYAIVFSRDLSRVGRGGVGAEAAPHTVLECRSFVQRAASEAAWFQHCGAQIDKLLRDHGAKSPEARLAERIIRDPALPGVARVLVESDALTAFDQEVARKRKAGASKPVMADAARSRTPSPPHQQRQVVSPSSAPEQPLRGARDLGHRLSQEAGVADAVMPPGVPAVGEVDARRHARVEGLQLAEAQPQQQRGGSPGGAAAAAAAARDAPVRHVPKFCEAQGCQRQIPFLDQNGNARRRYQQRKWCDECAAANAQRRPAQDDHHAALAAAVAADGGVVGLPYVPPADGLRPQGRAPQAGAQGLIHAAIGADDGGAANSPLHWRAPRGGPGGRGGDGRGDGRGRGGPGGRMAGR